MDDHHNLRTHLAANLPSIEVGADLLNQLYLILRRNRSLYSSVSEKLDIARGQLFLTISKPELPTVLSRQPVNSTKLTQSCGNIRTTSMQILEEVFLSYLKLNNRFILLDDGRQRPQDPKMTEYIHQRHVLSCENNAFFCLDHLDAADEVGDFIWSGTGGNFPLGVMGVNLDRNVGEAISFVDLTRFVATADGVVFAVCDGEVFAIWSRCEEA